MRRKQTTQAWHQVTLQLRVLGWIDGEIANALIERRRLPGDQRLAEALVDEETSHGT